MGPSRIDSFIPATGSLNRRLVVNEEASGPRLVAVECSFRGRLLSCLAKVPLLRDIAAIKRYTECVRTENQRALQCFIEALNECYKDESVNAVRDAIAKHPQRPLTGRTVQNLREIAANFHGKGDAKSLTRHVVFRVWPYKDLDHPGHTSLTVKDNLHSDPSQQKQHISWGSGSEEPTHFPASRLKTALTQDLFARYKGASLDGYRTDKILALSERTKKRLEQGYQAARKGGDDAHRALTPPTNAQEIIYRPYADQKRYGPPDGTGDWGRSAKKIYIEVMGHCQGPNDAGNTNRFVMFGLDEHAMREEIGRIKSAGLNGSIGYTMASKTENCAAIALRVLRAGGAERWVPFKASCISEDPNRAYAYAEAVQTKLDALNRYVREIDAHCSATLARQEVKEQWSAFATSESITRLGAEIDQLKKQMTTVQHPTKRVEVRQRLKRCLHAYAVELDTRFGVLAASQSKNTRLLVRTKHECMPMPGDDVATLSRKAQALVEVLHQHIAKQQDPSLATLQLTLATDATIKCIKNLMAIQMS